jgi:hypothetical protein
MCLHAIHWHIHEFCSNGLQTYKAPIMSPLTYIGKSIEKIDQTHWNVIYRMALKVIWLGANKKPFLIIAEI